MIHNFLQLFQKAGAIVSLLLIIAYSSFGAGKSDNEIFQDAVLQNALGAGMQAGSKAHEAIAARLGKPEFTRTEAQTAIKEMFREEVGRTAGEQMQQAVREIEVETVAAHLEQNGSLSVTKQSPSTMREGVNAKVAELQLGARNLKQRAVTAREEIVANWGKDNKLVTRDEMQAARERISQKLAATGRQMNIGADPSVLADMAQVATGHIEAGVRSVEQLREALGRDALTKDVQMSEAESEQLFNKAADEYLTKARGTLSKEGQAEFDNLRQSIGDEKLLNRLPDDAAKTIKMFNGMAASRAREAALPPRTEIPVASPEYRSNGVVRREFRESFRLSYDRYAGSLGKARAEQPFLKNVPTEDLVAIKAYTDEHFEGVNIALRSQDEAKLAARRAQIACTTSGLNQLPDYKGVVYRVTDLTTAEADVYKPGSIVEEKAFNSATYQKEEVFKGNTQFIIYSETGKKIDFLSENPQEKEVLFRPNTKFAVEEVSVDQTGKRSITLREVK